VTAENAVALAIDYDFGGGKRGGAAIVAELSGREAGKMWAMHASAEREVESALVCVRETGEDVVKGDVGNCWRSRGPGRGRLCGSVTKG
jgi:hypothetical protein